MKLPVKVVLFVGGILYSLLILMAVTSRSVRESEAEQALAASVEQSFKYLMSENGYKIGGYDELIADFNQNLILRLNSDSDLKVEVLTADLEKGILDIRVTEGYQTVSGKRKEAVCRKTVLLEQFIANKKYFVVTYMVDGKIFNQYSIYSGGTPIVPNQPRKEGYHFQHWSLQNSRDPVDFSSLEITEDVTFSAVFK